MKGGGRRGEEDWEWMEGRNEMDLLHFGIAEAIRRDHGDDDEKGAAAADATAAVNPATVLI